MIELKSKRSRAAAYAGAAVLVIGFIFFLLRGPYLSNYIKRIIVPQLENITRERIMIDKAVINLFPFYVQAKGLKMSDKDGNKLLWVTKTRAYVELTPLLAGEIRVRKLTIREPDLTADENDLKRIAGSVKRSSFIGVKGRFSVSLKNIELTDGRLEYEDASGGTGISGKGLFLKMVTDRDTVSADLRFTDGVVHLPNGSDLRGGINVKAGMEEGKIHITEARVRSGGSSLDLRGELAVSQAGDIESGTLEGGGKIYVSTIIDAFGVEEEDGGALAFNGTVELADGKDSEWPDIVLDLNTESTFYLETLMAVIGVEENVTGLAAVKGQVKGTFPDLTGSGHASLENAVFDTLPLDDVRGDIDYRGGMFTLKDFTAHTYEGKLEGAANIGIENGDFEVTADVSDINSIKFFRYIGWEPPFPRGIVNGDFALKYYTVSGLEVTADIDYLNEEKPGVELTERLRTVTTSLELKGDMLTLGDTVFYTSRSKLMLSGGIDLQKNTLSLELSLDTEEINDLTAPDYTRFDTAGTFVGRAEGELSDPEISGRLYLDSGTLHGIPVSGAYALFTYRAGSLVVDKLLLEQNKASAELDGSIEFRDSEGLFSFKSPYYKAAAVLRNADIEQFAGLVSDKHHVEGKADGRIVFEGDKDDFNGTGELVVTDAVVHEQSISRADLKADFGPERVVLHPLDLYHGESGLSVKGTVDYDGSFDLALSSSDLDSCDIDRLSGHPLGVRFSSLTINGSGTVEDPDIEFSGHIAESYLNEKEIGTGDVEGTFIGRTLSFKGLFVDGLLSAEAEASFAGKPYWNADIDIRRGKYDFLLSGLIDRAPEDLSLTLNGGVSVRSTGDGHTFQGKFDHMGLGVWGYDLVNDKDVVLEFRDNELLIETLSLSGNNADVYASGTVRFKEGYDVVLIGNVDMASLSKMSDKVRSVRGRGAYIINVTGGWDAPLVNGEVSVKDTTAAITDMMYKIGPVNGTFVFERGRVTFDSVKTGFAGGTVDMSGVGYLDKLSIEKLYLSAELSDIKIRPLERVQVSLGGNLFYETSPEGSSFTGNIDIRKARYEKDVKFDKLILGLREMESRKTEYPAFIRDTAINIHVEGKDDIIIDNNIATTPVSLSLNLLGTVGQYGLIGKVDARGGNIFFRNNEFTILKGSSVEFISSESVVPVFHILAESYISDYYVKLSLDGTMDQFNLSLFSDPPLSETDILTLLTFGHFRKGVKGFESGLAASEAASILTGDLQEVVESKFRNLTGFERFEIESHTTASGAFGPKVTIGKRLIEDKLSVIYSTSVGTTEEHIIRLKYNISKSVAVIGSRDEIGSAGVDLKYRFEFK